MLMFTVEKYPGVVTRHRVDSSDDHANGGPSAAFLDSGRTCRGTGRVRKPRTTCAGWEQLTNRCGRFPDGADAVVNLALPGAALVSVSEAIRPEGRLLNAAFPSPDPSSTVRT